MFKDKQVKSLAGEADVTQYMKTTHVSCWLIVALAVIIISFIVAWLFIGKVITTENITGYYKDGHIHSYLNINETVLNNYGKYKNAKVAKDGKIVGVIVNEEVSVYTYDQVKEKINNQYLFDKMDIGERNVAVDIDVDPSKFEEGVQSVDIILSEMQPFEILTS